MPGLCKRMRGRGCTGACLNGVSFFGGVCVCVGGEGGTSLWSGSPSLSHHHLRRHAPVPSPLQCTPNASADALTTCHIVCSNAHFHISGSARASTNQMMEMHVSNANWKVTFKIANGHSFGTAAYNNPDVAKHLSTCCAFACAPIHPNGSNNPPSATELHTETII